MNKLHCVSGLLARLSFALMFLAGNTVCIAQVTDISQAELMKRIKANKPGLILDVRSAGEYAKGHIPGAINIPYDKIGSHLAEIDSHKNKDIVLYCGSGGRVVTAAYILQTAGFSKLLHLDGDMDGWRKNGNLPINK